MLQLVELVPQLHVRHVDLVFYLSELTLVLFVLTVIRSLKGKISLQTLYVGLRLLLVNARDVGRVML